MTDPPKNIVDPARMKRVVEQTVERIRTDAQFRGIIQQTMTAAHDRNQHTAAMNVALVLVQMEQKAREEVLAKLIMHAAKWDDDMGDSSESNLAGHTDGLNDAAEFVQKLCDDFGAVKILRATQTPPTDGEAPRLET